MIVTPDFFEHWKTRLLVELTKDESAPLAIMRFWGFCHTSRRWRFPDMTSVQLASICRWGSRQPACHIALIKAGFVDRLEKGFAAHDWQEANGQLIQKWEAGKKGGRPAETDRLAPVSRKQTDLTSLDQIELKKKGSAQDILTPHHDPVAENTGKAGISMLNGLVDGLVAKKDVSVINAPSFQEVEKFFAELFHGAQKYAAAFYSSKSKSGWKDGKGQPIRDWKKVGAAYASSAESNNRGVTKRR